MSKTILNPIAIDEIIERAKSLTAITTPIGGK